MTVDLLSLDAYRRAVSIRDLTDPGSGPHAMQRLVADIAGALHARWGCEVRVCRMNPVVPIEDNYDRLGYTREAAARDARYTRYVSDRLLLRTQTSAMIPPLLDGLAAAPPPDVLLACPGLCYRRDAIDRLHTGEPHQLDLWRVRSGLPLGPGDLEDMIAAVLRAALPGYRHRAVASEHPYTRGGLQIDVAPAGVEDGTWIEIGECGLASPAVLERPGLDKAVYSGLAMGLGLDRLLMLRKGIDDIRLLRAEDPRIAGQMLDLAAYRPVSDQPATRRDMSIAIAAGVTAEELGDRVRAALGARADAVEEVAVVAETPYEQLPVQAVTRMGVLPHQKNVLLRVVLRDPSRTLTRGEANALRNAIYAALHEGDNHEWA
jgi:phenylalanyl-tRNA synthetase alpha chain